MAHSSNPVKTGEKYRGIDLSKIQMPRLLGYIQKHEIPPPKGKRYAALTEKELVDLYSEHIVEGQETAESIYDCDACGAITFSDGPCPVCGDEGQPAAEATGDEGQPAEESAASEPEPEKPEPEKPEPAKEEGSKSEKPAKPKRTQVVLHQSEVVQPGSIVDLDASVAKIRACAQRTIEHFYELGKEIDGIMKSGAWKLRKNDKGGVKYSKIEQFFQEECDLQPAAAYQFAAVSRFYDLETAKKVGFGKLRRLVSVPAEYQPRLLEMASSGTHRDLAAELKNLAPLLPKPARGKRGPVEGRGGRKKGGALTSERMAGAEERSSATPRRTRPEGTLTTVFTLGKSELKLKRQTVKGRDVLVAQELHTDGCKIEYTVRFSGKEFKLPPDAELVVNRISPV